MLLLFVRNVALMTDRSEKGQATSMKMQNVPLADIVPIRGAT